MEDATITNMPDNKSLITMDDMFIQIGKLHIDNINSIKIINKITTTFNKYKQDMSSKIIDADKSIETTKELKVSNDLYQLKHTESSNKIQELQSEISLKNRELSKLQVKINNLEKKPLTKSIKKK